jgi:hypothetical protein
LDTSCDSHPIPASKLLASHCRSDRGACGFVLVGHPEVIRLIGTPYRSLFKRARGATPVNLVVTHNRVRRTHQASAVGFIAFGHRMCWGDAAIAAIIYR